KPYISPEAWANYGRGSTITLPHMVWWAMPQYSWHRKGYVPALWKRVVTRVTCPGRSMALTFAARSIKPWITSLLGMTNVTSDPSRHADLWWAEKPDPGEQAGLIVTRGQLDHAWLVKRRRLHHGDGVHASSLPR